MGCFPQGKRATIAPPPFHVTPHKQYSANVLLFPLTSLHTSTFVHTSLQQQQTLLKFFLYTLGRTIATPSFGVFLLSAETLPACAECCSQSSIKIKEICQHYSLASCETVDCLHSSCCLLSQSHFSWKSKPASPPFKQQHPFQHTHHRKQPQAFSSIIIFAQKVHQAMSNTHKNSTQQIVVISPNGHPKSLHT